jgi:hypothetical protein
MGSAIMPESSRVATRRLVVTLVAGVAVVAVVGGMVMAERPARRLATTAGAEPVEAFVPDTLPEIDRVAMDARRGLKQSTVLLQYDDGSCEGGLGLTGGSWSSLVDFDVPTTYLMGGRSLLAFSVKANTNTAMSFVLYQAGSTPGVGARTAIPLSPPIIGDGPCPSTAPLQYQAIPPGAAVITNTSNFFAGFFGNAFLGRDTNGVSAGRMWICTSSAAGCYSPTYLASLGFGGNWMIRVTVDNSGWIPVELSGFGVD